ncbi:MAG: BON domain-containing protein [Pseudomonadota bacterium]
MRLIILIVWTFSLSACTAMVVGGGGKSTTTSSNPTMHRAADTALRTEIRNKLAAHPELSMFDVDVTVSRGFVTLTGEVQGYKAREAAEKIAMSADGVGGVKNRITVTASK